MKTLLKLLPLTIAIILSSCQNKNEIDFYSIPANGNPNQVKISENNLIVGNWNQANISRFELDKFQLLDSIKLDSTFNKYSKEFQFCPPNDIVIAKEELIVSQSFCEDILILSKENMELKNRIPLIGGGKLALNNNANILAVGNRKKNKLFLVNLKTYQIDTFNFPFSGRGISSIHMNQDEIILGIQRGEISSKQGNCFAAYFDLKNHQFTDSTYLGEIDLVTNKNDISTPNFILEDQKYKKTYIGLFQSIAGIKSIDNETKKVKSKISFEPNGENSYFKWVDPLSLGIYKDWLLSLNRHNKEIVFIERSTEKKVCQIHFDEFSGSTNSFVIHNQIAYVADKRNDRIYIIPLDEIATKIDKRKNKDEMILLSGRKRDLEEFKKKKYGA